MTLERRPELEVASLSGEVDAVMRGIVDRLMALPGADGASLSTIDGDSAFFQVCVGADAPLEGRTFHLAETLGAECIDRGDLTVLRRTTGPEVDRCLTPGAASIVLAPVEWNGQTRGILGVRSADIDAFDENGVEKIRLLAAGASIALRNAEVVEALAASERNYRELHDRRRRCGARDRAPRSNPRCERGSGAAAGPLGRRAARRCTPATCSRPRS